MRPDEETNNAFLYCLIVAAIRFGIEILMTVAESDHHHTGLFDRFGNVSQFMEYFHKLFARSQNALRGRSENFWSSVEPSLVRLLDSQTVINKLVYIAANPVKDGLVERVHHWPGVNSYRNFIQQKPLHATRPRHFFRKNNLPQEVSLDLTIPPELGAAADVIAAVKEGVERVEASTYAERCKTGAGVVGRRTILKQSWKTTATDKPPARTLRPRFAGPASLRYPAILLYRAFVAAYRAARKAWLAGEEVLFPSGTLWLARFAKVKTEPVGFVLPFNPMGMERAGGFMALA